VREAREVIATELAHNVVSAIIRMRSEECVERRLDALGKILDALLQSLVANEWPLLAKRTLG
jgi:hypothetical protein